tara:strand:+ start:42 stop:278 length:237 start_codon:yes stop_codon:yes gene_type:complete
MTLTTEQLREEIYTDLIQEFDYLTHEQITDMVDVSMVINWIEDGNVEQVDEDTFIEQTTQWRKKFTLTELIAFYLKEF